MSTSLLDTKGRKGTEAFDRIPVIDLSRVGKVKDDVRDNPISRTNEEIATDIREACINVGFFYVKNHGVSELVAQKAFEAGKRFFDLPLESKVELDVAKSSTFKGYNGLLSENVNPENRGDLHEGFNIGPERLGEMEESAMRGENQWPREDVMEGFREDVMPYYDELVALGQDLFRLFALALFLPETFFDDKITESAAIMRLLHYPPQGGEVDDRVMGIGAHSDYECFTILRQDTVPALQVLNSDQQWINAPPIPNTFVVNIGDQFARWTNDIFKSTVHRAINRTGTRRYSIPLFFGTDYNLVISALPTCVSESYPARYAPVLAGEYVKTKLEAGYKAAFHHDRGDGEGRDAEKEG